MPNLHAIFVMALTVVALYLFTRSKIRVESTCLFIIVMLAVVFELFPFFDATEPVHAVDFFSGFGHEALVAVCALMVIGEGLARTGALEPVGRLLSRTWMTRPKLSLLLTLVVALFLSAFVNNVPIVILLLPILTSVSLRTKVPASRILMPMGCATILGGMTTTIGTSTNLLVVSVANDMGARQFAMFDFFMPAIIACGVGVLFLWLVVPYLLPKRVAPLLDTSPRIFSAQLKINEESFADGKTFADITEKTHGLMKNASLLRQGLDVAGVPTLKTIIRAGDMLLVRDTPEKLKEFEAVLGATLYSKDVPIDDKHPLVAEHQQLAEVIITENSFLDNSTLTRSRFKQRFQLVPLALHRTSRQGQKVFTKDLSDIFLEVGDVLLVQGTEEHIQDIKRSGDLVVLDATSDLPQTKKAPMALLTILCVVIVSALSILPIAISSVCGALILLATRCISWKDTKNAMNVQVILIVVASLALGNALLSTGGASYLAQLFVSVMQETSPMTMISGLMLVMAVMTNIVSNNAAAVIGTPIAISISQQLNLPADPFILAVLFGANMSYVTPMAYKTNILVMTAGGYKFSDFLRVGIPLTLLMWVTLSLVLSIMYGFL